MVGTATEALLSLPEAAERLGVSVYTVRRWIKEGKLRAFKPGKEYRVQETDLEEFLRTREVAPKAPRRSPSEPSFNDVLAEERRAADADVISAYEAITRDYRTTWRDALDALAASWQARLEAGNFDRRHVEQFLSDVVAISQPASRALFTRVNESLLQVSYKGTLRVEDGEELAAEAEATSIAHAAARLIDVCDRVYAAAAERFSENELETARRKHEEIHRALRPAA